MALCAQNDQAHITPACLIEYAAKYARFTVLMNDQTFPGWLTAREDFRDHFPRLKAEDTRIGPSSLIVEGAARTPPHERQPKEAEVILDWLRAHNCLSHIPASKLIRLCERLRLVDISAHTDVCTQGEIGDVSCNID